MPIVKSAFEGVSSVYFVYGQTGSGKTHTMGLLEESRERQVGIIPSILREVFTKVDSDESPLRSTNVYISFYQLYLDNIQDLLNP